MILRELLASTPVFEVIGPRRIDITGISTNVDEIKKGYLYIYVPKESQSPYEKVIEQAIKNGAVAICIGKEEKIPEDSVTFIRTYNHKRFLSAVSRNFYGNPSQNMSLVGITGSHGKTTVGWMVKSILNIAGIPGVMLGTSHCQVGDQSCMAYPGGMNPLNMNAFLSKAVKEEVRWGIIECTYTGITEDQFRHVWFDSIIYTDLYTYFKNHEADHYYFEMRKTLLDHLKVANSPVIINVDDYYASNLKRSAAVGYGLFNNADITARDLELLPGSSRFSLKTPQGNRKIELKVPGIHNIYNALAAVAWGLAEKLSLEEVVKGIEEFDGMPGEATHGHPTNKVTVTDVSDINLAEVKNAFGNLVESKKEDIVTILFISNSTDKERYKELGDIISQYSGYCIMISDYFSNKNILNTKLTIKQSIKDVIMHYETDHYKAIQKAMGLVQGGGNILIIKGDNIGKSNYK